MPRVGCRLHRALRPIQGAEKAQRTAGVVPQLHPLLWTLADSSPTQPQGQSEAWLLDLWRA